MITVLLRVKVLLALLVAVVLAGCSAAPPPAITATLVDPTDIRLNWRPAPSGALGQVVEYRNQPTARFITLAFLPPTATSYTHPRLMPKTVFYYRVRALFGHQTPPVTASGTPMAPPDPDWATPRAVPEHQPGLRATPVTDGGVLLTWTDQPGRVDAYLVEIGSRIAAVLPSGTDQVGVYPLPGERSATYRVAAIRYGPPTPTVSATTG